MTQNRNKLIGLLIGNLSNSVVHQVLEEAIILEKREEIANKYRKELTTSFEIAKKYRERINPADSLLPIKDIREIKDKIMVKVNAELRSRISKGYKNIDLGKVGSQIDNALRKMRIA